MFKEKTKGFTLIEILVSISVFSIIIAIVSSFFISSLKSQRVVFLRQEMLNQISYTMEYVSRSMRMAIKDVSGECIAAKANYSLINPSSSNFGGEVVTVGNGVSFKTYDGKCQSFYVDNNILWEDKRKPGESSNPIRLISSEIEILNLVTTLKGENQNDNVQPRVTFSMKVREKNTLPGIFSQTVKIETTVSQRNIDIRR